MSVRNMDLIEKMQSEDRDFRFMAVNDLIEALNAKTITLDDNSENQIIVNLMKLLNDSNAEVQNLVVRCIAVFSSHLGPVRAFALLEQLCGKLSDGDAKTRDAAAIAMRSAVGDFNSAKGVSFFDVVDRVGPNLIKILETGSDIAVNEQVLDIFVQIFRKAGNKYNYPFERLSDVFFKYTQSDRNAVRKRAQTALAQYAQVLDNTQFATLIERVYKNCVDNEGKPTFFKTYVLVATYICYHEGQRFATYIPRFAEFFLGIVEKNDDDDLRETLITAFETFIQRCPEAVAPFIERITTLVVELLKYDPNYSYEEEEDESMETDDAYVSGDMDEDSDYSDDDDVSWKVRRASAKCIEALITHAPAKKLAQYVSSFGNLLISRFKEREDNVKVDILNAYIALLKQVRMLIPENVVPLSVRNDSIDDTAGFKRDAFEAFLKESDRQRSAVFAEVKTQLPTLIHRLAVVQKGKNSRALERSFTLLSTLLSCYPGSIGTDIALLKRGFTQAFADRDANLKLDALRFLGAYFGTHDYESYDACLDDILKELATLVNATFSKIASEAVEVINSLIRSLGRSGAPSDARIEVIYDLLLAKLQIADLDQEVKEKAIYGIGLFVAAFGDRIPPAQVDSILKLLADRLGNEITRIASLKALLVVTRSKKAFNMHEAAKTIVPYLGDFLRKVSRTLRIHTLNLAVDLAARSPDTLANIDLSSIVGEIPLLLAELDLQVANLTLRLLTLFVSQHPNALGKTNVVVNCVIGLAQSSLIQGTTQRALLDFFTALQRSSVPDKPNYEALVTELIGVVPKKLSLHRNAYSTLAKSIAAIAKATDNIAVVKRITSELEQYASKGTTDAIKLLGILTIGEIGRIYPAAYEGAGSIDPAVSAVNCFTSSVEELKTGASEALGALAVGNIQRYLPFILEQIKQYPARQYLLLFALRELVTSNAADATFEAHIDTIWSGVISQATSPEISTRLIVAECLGKLALAHPEKFVPILLTTFRDVNPVLRATVLVAVRYMILERPVPADAVLATYLDDFLDGVGDPDLLGARRQGIVLATAVAHFKPALIRKSLNSVTYGVYFETNPRKELQHEVEMGPFKHLVDDGLELRKSAFECLYTLVEHCLGSLNVHEFVTHVAKGIVDSHDIALLAYLTLIRLTRACPLQLAPHIDNMTEAMKETLNKKPKQNSVKLENDKCEELKRCVIRTMLAFQAMPTHDKIKRLEELFEFVSQTFPTLLAEVKHEVEFTFGSKTNV
uniref:TIP120 domain-containing protein n=1 Tax=Panagrellus redivivus TaxID=6233 RepID=A0A7E4UW66_PANRE